MKIEDIRRGEIETFHKRLRKTPYLANRVLALLSSLFSYVERIEWRDPGSNPAHLVSRFQEASRERYLSVDEIQRIGGAITELLHERNISLQAAAGIKLLLLTGACLREIFGIKVEWIDLERRMVLLPDSKTGKKILFLSMPAVEIIREAMVPPHF